MDSFAPEVTVESLFLLEQNCHCDCTVASNLLRLYHCKYIVCHTLQQLKYFLGTPYKSL